MTRQGCVSSPFSLIQNRTDGPGASFTHLRRSALQPPLQCTATAPAVHCIRPRSALHPSSQCTASSMLIHATFPASTCNRPCKYLRSPQSIASFPASVCLFWHKRYPSPDFVHPIPTCRYAPLCVRMTAKSFSYVSESSFGHGLFAGCSFFTYHI